MIEPIVSILAILGAVLIGAMSPGPSFVVVARNSIALSRAAGLAAALGMGFGGLLYAGAAFLGLHVLLASVPSLYLALKFGGALYLICFAIRLWRKAGDPLAVGEPRQVSGFARAFAVGLATQTSNPKTAIVYAGIFTALLPADPPGWMAPTVLPLIFAVEAGWYALVALEFSSERPRQRYLRSKVWVDRMAACVMGALGVKLAAEIR